VSGQPDERRPPKLYAKAEGGRYRYHSPVGPRRTLIDFFADLERARGEFVVYDDGYRSRAFSYAEVAAGARALAARLHGEGIGKGDRIIFWGENRPEWIAALWGCLLRGVIAVPIDYRASAELVERIRGIVHPRALVAGHDVQFQNLDSSVPIWPLSELLDARAQPDPALLADVEIGPNDTAEIIFTSGATADPKGVVITHKNILANIVPVEREVEKYRKYGRPFRPIRFLNLLPLSHMFGQAMATFIPPMLPGVVVFMRGYNPNEIIRQIKTRRVSVLVCVPKILDVLRDHVVRLVPEAADPVAEKSHFLRRWWRYRDVHRLFGWKFWCFVVGAAPLDSKLEESWGRLGFLVVQGYGLTETAPIVTLNHPFRAQKGTVGTPIGGVEVKIAPDGEILVRGDNVTTGYYGRAEETAAAFDAEGWFHTGDIGAFDEAGGLLVRGRKKEMIVTPEGLNVFPEDVERVLNQIAGVRESGVVGITRAGEERVHAVAVLEPDVNPDAVVRQANAALEDHQKIRGFAAWPGAELPRTEGTRKLKRREIKRWLESGGQAGTAIEDERSVESVLARFVGDRATTRDTTIDELGLSSLERVELMMALEERFQTTIDEASFNTACTVGDIYRLVETDVGPAPGVAPGAAATAARPRAPAPAEIITFPSWSRGAFPRLIRRLSLPTWILPLARLFAWIRVEGREHLASLDGPVIFAANHQSHIDTPAVLAALPARWRYRVAPAMAKEFFKAHFYPEQYSWRPRLTNSLNYYLASLFFNAFPLPQREAGTRQTLRYVGELVEDGFSILIYPEGKRSQAGEINRFLPGAAMMASRLGVPVVPVRLIGLEKVLHQKAKMARPAWATVRFGPPMRLRGDDFAALALDVERAVSDL
jgi:long-chain acyl-CoA synthetase